MAVDFVFTTFEFGGHVTPALWVARRMQDRGWSVLVISDEASRAEADSFGLPFEPWRTAPNRLDKDPAHELLQDWRAAEPAETLAAVCRAVISDPAARYAADTAAVLKRHPGAVLVTQELLFGCMAAAEAGGAPLALLTANIWPFPTRDDVPPFGAGLEPASGDAEAAMHPLIRAAACGLYDQELEPLNAARAALRLPPLEHLLDQPKAADAILLGTAQAFDFAEGSPPAPFRYVGPQVRRPFWAAHTWVSPFAPDDERPLVLVSFSTLYQAQERALSACIAALGRLPVRGLVTLGSQLDPAAFQAAAPQNVVVVESADHDALMPQVCVAITHGGHGSVVRPLLHGVPLLVMPMGRDQPDNAARVRARGAGLVCPPDAEPAAIAEAVCRLIEEPAFRDAARGWGDRIAAETAGRDAACEALEALRPAQAITRAA